MASVTLCDRCGATCHYTRVNYQRGGIHYGWDLCDPCGEKFLIFIKKKG